MDLSDLNSSREKILNLYGKTDKNLECDLGILKEWMKKQRHLPMDLLQDGFLELHLLKNKFSIEKTKSKIENYCTLKGLNRFKYLFEDDICLPSEEPQFYIPLPNLTDDSRRIIVAKLCNQEDWVMKRELANVMVFREILSRFDYNDGEIFLYDWTDCSPMILSKFRANVLGDAMDLVLKAHSARIKEIHIICKFATAIFNWIKPFVPSKISSRIFVHDSIEAATNSFPSKCLPKDYGGELKSLHEFRADFDRIYSEHRHNLLQYLNTKAREEQRLGGSVTDEMEGTFRKLDID